MSVGAQALIAVAIVAFPVHIGFPERSAISRVAGVLMVVGFVGFCAVGSGTVGVALDVLGAGAVVVVFAAYRKELRRGVRMLPRRPLHVAGLAVALWGLLVGLHAVGAPGARLLRIPGATALAPASVQRAAKTHASVDPFADAGSREDIDEVKRQIAALVARQASHCSPARVTGWDGVYVGDGRALALTEERNACSPSGSKLELFLRRVDGRWRLDGETPWDRGDEYSGA